MFIVQYRTRRTKSLLLVETLHSYPRRARLCDDRKGHVEAINAKSGAAEYSIISKRFDATVINSSIHKTSIHDSTRYSINKPDIHIYPDNLLFRRNRLDRRVATQETETDGVIGIRETESD